MPNKPTRRRGGASKCGKNARLFACVFSRVASGLCVMHISLGPTFSDAVECKTFEEEDPLPRPPPQMQ